MRFLWHHWLLIALGAYILLAPNASTGRAGTQGVPRIVLPTGVPMVPDPGTQEPLTPDWYPIGSAADGTLPNSLPGDNGNPAGDPFTIQPV